METDARMTAPVSQVLSEAAVCPPCNGSGFAASDLCGFCSGSGGVPIAAAQAFYARADASIRAAALAKEQGR